MAKIDALFQELSARKGSDLHISEGQPAKIRVHGGIHAIREEILTHDEMESMMTEICDQRAWDRYSAKGDLDFAYEMDDDNRFRCNYFKQNKGYGAVFRIIPTKIATLEQLECFAERQPQQNGHQGEKAAGHHGGVGSSLSRPYRAGDGAGWCG
jgi:twitching motility protein PilT